MTLFALERDTLKLGPQMADVMYRFFVDGLCRQVCAGHIPHDDIIVDARHRLTAANLAPPAVGRVKAGITETGNPWGEAERDWQALTNARHGQKLLIYFGSTARVKRPGVIGALARILDKLDVGYSVLEEEADPGLLLYQLGERQAGEAAAKEFIEKIRSSGAQTVVTPDAEAYQMLKSGLGGQIPLHDREILHSSEFIERHLGGLTLGRLKYRRIAYHDPCVLARMAPCMIAPRSIVRQIGGVEPVEIGPWSRETANCSGECGGVQFTVPSLSKMAAERRVREAAAVEADVIVTGTPAAAVALNGHGIKVLDLCEFVSEAL
jgi:Fe-S oxidoreductase